MPRADLLSERHIDATQRACKAQLRSRLIELLILAGSEHNPDGLNGSGDNPLAIYVDLHLEAHVNPVHLREAASECGPGEPCR
jgi:hypothetical protein